MNKTFVKRVLKDFIDLGEVEIKTGPFGTQLHASDYVEKGTSVINVRNIGYGRIKTEKLEYINEETVQRLSSHLLKHNDIVFGRKGAVDRHALIGSNQQGWFQGSDCLRIRIKSESVDPCYLSYCFLTDNHKKWMMAQCSHGATMASLNQDIISRIQVCLPNIQIQKKIASILSSYDNLIENNTRRIEILEQMAKLVYEEWFVKFRFPGHENVKMIPSELGEIPEGWKVRKVSEILKRFKAGKKYTQDNVLEEGLTPVIDQSEKEILGFHNDIADHSASLKNPIMIFGDHTCKIKILIEPFSVGPNVIPFRSESYPEIFVFFLIKNLVQTKEYKRHWNELQAKKVVLPDVPLAMDFVNVVNPLFKQITLLEHKNQNLRKTRDLLLPKLISGEIDVSDLDIRIRNEVRES
ncbi:Type I restriction-modification system specificity subunit [Methanosarcina lacustris Z-7289]|uniref:Type I restriction-modification system specificity subunit n=1 Tax=Methanosarcina lacustris Z-7289 TaxID=1434111 RepID=A0A0E3S4B6_9EURY|nr:restriction endonuclease subunit S [Methanosarcina lacustris]AKB75081.1 Type I restriction-modification system specificity subunit [Methanosarcina lacustris Z-7289]